MNGSAKTLTSCFSAIPQQTQMIQCSRTLLRSPYRVQNLPITAQWKTALEHQFLHFGPTEAQSQSFVTLCDQLWLFLTFQDPWHCSSGQINSLIIPSHSHQWHCFRGLSPDLKFNQSQIVLPFCLSHTESLWLTLSHSAAHYSSPLGITHLHYPPYQSLTNHPTNHAAYQFLTHAPMLPMYYIITYAHLASIYSSHAFPPSLLAPMQWFSFILDYAPLFTYVFAHSLGSAPCSGFPHRLLSLITLLTNHLPISYQVLSHLCLQGHPSCIYTSSQRLQGSVCFPLNKAITFTLPLCL